ncbi:MAG: DUF4349 domain-containing protein [Oscillospiraceae bacterium]|nr:DUF4349 domain-containing protein [Oscillospiraceae bacterium]
MKNLKKNSLAVLLSAPLIFSLFACGASGGGVSMYDTSENQAYPAGGSTSSGSAPAPEAAPMPDSDIDMNFSYAGESGAGAARSVAGIPPPSIDSAKIVYSAYASVETQDFDATIEGVYAMIERYGGFLENSSVTGSDYYSRYYGDVSSRSANFTIRFPSEFFKEVTGSLSDLGNVPYCNTSAENITSRYYDTQSRLNSYLTQESRLLEMLGKADSLEDMLAIEDRLADVRYNIEALTTSLRGMDSLVNFSTLSLSVSEVAEYTKEVPVIRSYWEQIGDGLSSTLSGTGSFFKGLFKWFIISLPVLIVLAVVAVAVLLLRKRSRKNKPQQ